jgi:hypothetical protein
MNHKMLMCEAEAVAEAELVCDTINNIMGAIARYEYTSNSYGKKFIQINATIEYVEDGDEAHG